MTTRKDFLLRFGIIVLSFFCAAPCFTACNNTPSGDDGNTDTGNGNAGNDTVIETTTTVNRLESGLSAVRFDGDYYFGEFLLNGGASSDSAVVNFLSEKIGASFSFEGNPFGCSTLAVPSEKGYVFGRNFDWYACDALIVESHSEGEYASISTVNTNFISGIDFADLPDSTKSMIALYAPIDGMNEKGLAVSVNMISDGRNINQTTEKADITTTTAIRLILNKAANVTEAVELLREYDLHASMGYMVHFAIADNFGNSVCVEYVDNRITVTESKIVTNFYLAENAPSAPDYTQAHTRFHTLIDIVNGKQFFTVNDVKDALSSVSRKNYGGSETTEWSTVYELGTGKATYYHRENFNKGYTFAL